MLHTITNYVYIMLCNRIMGHLLQLIVSLFLVNKERDCTPGSASRSKCYSSCVKISTVTSSTWTWPVIWLDTSLKTPSISIYSCSWQGYGKELDGWICYVRQSSCKYTPKRTRLVKKISIHIVCILHMYSFYL